MLDWEEQVLIKVIKQDMVNQNWSGWVRFKQFWNLWAADVISCGKECTEVRISTKFLCVLYVPFPGEKMKFFDKEFPLSYPIFFSLYFFLFFSDFLRYYFMVAQGRVCMRRERYIYRTFGWKSNKYFYWTPFLSLYGIIKLPNFNKRALQCGLLGSKSCRIISIITKKVVIGTVIYLSYCWDILKISYVFEDVTLNIQQWKDEHNKKWLIIDVFILRIILKSN